MVRAQDTEGWPAVKASELRPGDFVPYPGRVEVVRSVEPFPAWRDSKGRAMLKIEWESTNPVTMGHYWTSSARDAEWQYAYRAGHAVIEIMSTGRELTHESMAAAEEYLQEHAPGMVREASADHIDYCHPYSGLPCFRITWQRAA